MRPRHDGPGAAGAPPGRGTLTLARGCAILAGMPPVGTELTPYRTAYREALAARDSGRAHRVVMDALAAGAPIVDVYLDVLQPALQAVGHEWAMGEANVADEHYATAVTQQLLAELSARMRVPPRDGRLAVVTATPGELHALGARVVADLLEADGWEVLQLGAATPAGDLAELVDAERPDVVALSTTTAGALPGVAEVLARLRELRPTPLLVVGGQFWTAETSGVARELGADLVVRDPRDLVPVLREHVAPPEIG
jgi:MerR family transcriptional regulator, light-induced transcriptional regulator